MMLVYRDKSNHDDRLWFDAKTAAEERARVRDLATKNGKRASDYEIDPLYQGHHHGRS